MSKGNWARRHAGLLAGGAVVLAAILGAVGNRAGFPTDSPTDTAYRTVQLYALEVSRPSAGTPWTLDVARFLAPVAIAVTAVLAVLALARQQVLRVLARLFGGQRLMIVGMGPVAAVAAREARPRPLSVLILCDPARAATVENFADRWWPVVTGEASDVALLRSLRLDRARHIVIATGDDSLNLQALAACQRLLSERASDRRSPHIHIEIGDINLWRELHVLAFTEDRGPVVEVFNPSDRIAQVMTARIQAASESPRRVLVRAPDEMVERLALHLGAGQTKAERPSLVLTGPDAQAQRERVLALSPWLDGQLGSNDAQPEADAALICGLPDAEALAAAATIGRDLECGSVYVAVSDDTLVAALPHTPLRDSRIEAVAAEPQAFGPDLLKSARSEVLAQAKHDEYRATQLALGVTLAENKSLVPWFELPESLKESNRAFARGVGPMLKQMGFSLVPLGTYDLADFEFSDEQVERLAAAEHARWVRDLQADGWQLAPGAKDDDTKRHPLLISWEKLGESEREKDRSTIRAIPTLVHKQGYAIIANPNKAGTP